MPGPARVWFLPLIACLACAATPDDALDAAGDPGDDPADAADAPLLSGKADGLCGVAGTPAEAGLLALANDPHVTWQQLDAPVADGGVGLDRRAAQGIVDARPLSSLQDLDDVPYVGVRACEALATYACNEARLCRTPVRAMSWNLRHFPQNAGTPAAVVSLVQDLRPAVIGIQEIEDTEAFDTMLEGLPGYVGMLGEPGPFTRVGIVYDASVLEVTAVQDLFVQDWYAFPRPVLAVTAAVRGALTPTVFTFAVVHLKASPGTANEARRRDAVGKLRDWVAAERAAGHDNVVVVGDWNDALTDPADHDVFAALREADLDTTFLTQPAADAGAVTLIPYDVMLDHVLVTDATLAALDHVQTEVLALDQTWSSDYMARVSDHRPVMTTFAAPVGY